MCKFKKRALMMSFRYQLLQEFLKKSNKSVLKMTLTEIEKICGFKLPKSASIPSWWSNTPENGHSQAKAWTDEGYRVMGDGDMKVFIKNK
jgi:hypothetical protein